MPTTPKCRERLSRRHLPNPMRKRAHAEALPNYFFRGGAAFHRGDGRPSLPRERVQPPCPPGDRKPFAALFVHPTVGPLVEEAVRAQGHRGAAPYGVEEAKRARGGRELEDFASNDEEEEVSSDEEADSKANQPNDKAAGVALRTQ